MNFFPSIPPPPAPPPPPQQPSQNVFTTTNGGVYSLSEAQISAIGDTSSSSSSSSSTSSIIVVSIVISSAIILSIIIYVLIRFITHRSSRTYASADHISVPHNATTSVPPPPNSGNRNVTPTRYRLDSLPLFKFGSVTKNLTGGGDCAVCLSKFESNNQLRLLPLCCHAFHARCIDTWLSNNQTCPLCRSTVFPTESDVSNKITSIPRENENTGDSFRIEIGSVSQRRGLPDAAAEGTGERRRTYTLGSFDYIVDDGFEIPVDSTKECIGGIVVEAPPGECLAAEVGGGSGRNWLKDYVERLTTFSVSSQSTSFRSSGRFFSGSSRRNDVVIPVDEDLEANHRVGEEISELFRWISGV